jgi:hypothetical protein
LIEPVITAWKQDRVARSATGDPGSRDLKEIVKAMRAARDAYLLPTR